MTDPEQTGTEQPRPPYLECEDCEYTEQTGSEQQDRRIRELEERVRELEKIIDRELGYSLRPVAGEPQSVDCDCGTTFDVNLDNGATCPDCGVCHG